MRFVLPTYLLIEASATFTVASWLGLGPTLLLLILSAAAGTAVLRSEQFSLLSRLRRILRANEPLVPELLDAALRGAAGLLLIIPGFISDLAAVGLLIPHLRRSMICRLLARLDNQPPAPAVIESDYRRIDYPALSVRSGDPGDP